jgi:hypothetical protein
MTQALQQNGALLLISWAAGLNLYLSVAAAGITARMGWLELPGGLETLKNPFIIGLAILMYAVQFLADKIPFVDSAWDSVHTLIRPAGAATMGFLAGTQYGPIAQTGMAIVTGTIALNMHAFKASSRLAINTSPEPFSNIAASVAEDSLVLSVFWFFIKHPILACLAIIAILVLCFLLLKLLWSFVAKLFSSLKPKKPAEVRGELNQAAKILLLFAFLSAFHCVPAFADTLRLRNGSALDGRVVRESEKSITFEIDGGEIDFSRAEILRIDKNEKVDESPVKKPAAPAQATAEREPAPPQAPRDLSKLEKPEIHFDGRMWKIGFQNANNRGVIAEFVLEGETVENWSELVTAQLIFVDPSNFDIVAYAEQMKGYLEKTCPANKWNYIQRDEQSVIYIWSVTGCVTGPDQTEIARIIRGKDGIHALHYAIKTAQIPEEKKDQWVRLLRESRILPGTN